MFFNVVKYDFCYAVKYNCRLFTKRSVCQVMFIAFKDCVGSVLGGLFKILLKRRMGIIFFTFRHFIFI
jgi:hypothetical protein